MSTTAADAFHAGRPALFINEIRDVGVVGGPVEIMTPELMNYLVTSCRGIVYVALPEARLDALSIPRQPQVGGGPDHLHVPVDAVRDVTTGISAADRTETLQRLVDPTATPEDFRQPGHITPMAVHEGGILRRLGLAESILESAQLAGFSSQALAFCAVLTTDGDMAGFDALTDFATREDLAVETLASALRHRRQEVGWERQPPDVLDMGYVDWVAGIESRGAGDRHDDVLVRVVPLCVRGHGLRSCACTEQRREDAAWLAGPAPRSLVVTWPRSSVPSCDHALDAGLGNRISELIAADHFGATPVID